MISAKNAKLNTDTINRLKPDKILKEIEKLILIEIDKGNYFITYSEVIPNILIVKLESLGYTVISGTINDEISYQIKWK